MNKLIALALIYLACCISFAKAQSYDFGFQLGTSIYFGDLDAPQLSKNLGNNSIAAALFLRYPLTDLLNVRANVMFGSLKADDSRSDQEWQKLRNLSFKTSLIELGVLGELNLLKFVNENSQTSIRPYLAAGITYFHFNPKTLYQGRWYDLQNLGTEGQGLSQYPELKPYSLHQLSIPFGGGIEYKISDNFSIGFEILSRKTFTDYIDDVSGEYIDYFELMAGNGVLAANLANRMGEYLGQSEPVVVATGTIRGKSDVKDYYLTSMMTIVYHMPGKSYGKFKNGEIGCPKFE